MLVAERSAGAQEIGETAYQGSDGTGVRIVESSRTRIVLEVDLADYSAAHQAVGDRVYELLSIPGWSLTQQPGMPQLPVRRVLLGVPPEADLRLTVLTATVQEAGPFRILPAPEKILQGDLLDPEMPWLSSPQFETRHMESAVGYSSTVYQPAAVARLGEAAWLRSQRVVAIDLYPILYNAALGRIHFHPHFRVELSFSPAPGHRITGAAQEEPLAFEQLFEQQLLNYELAREWRSPAGLALDSWTSVDWPLSSDAYRIVVTETGLYQLTYDFLVQGGIPAEILSDLDPQKIQVSWMGQEIPIRVVGEEDHSFDTEDYVLFYGQSIEDKYTNENVYWLTYGPETGRRMARRSGQPSGSEPSPSVFLSNVRIEEERAYMPQWPGDDATDRWYWRAIYSPPLAPEDPTFLTATIDLGHVSTQSMSSTLWISMKGQSSEVSITPDHHAVFYVNDYLVGEHHWDGADTVEWVPVEFPQSVLTSGINTFKTDFPGISGVPLERVLFDRYELIYGHAYQADSDQLEFSQTTPGTFDFDVAGFTVPVVEVYDITEPLSVTRIISGVVSSTGTSHTVRFSDTVPNTRTYMALTPDRWLVPVEMVHHAPTGLRDPANAADYLIISHAQFLPAAHQLAAYRASQGHHTLVVDVQDVYDEFGFGLAVPHAIRDFMRYAYQNWQSLYLVLLGDGTYDPKNHLNQGVVSYLTPYLGFVDPWLGETATDNWFVAVSGEDILPDLHLGRLPANTLSEAQTMVDKIIAYEQAVDGTDWAKRLTFVAGLQPDPKGAGDFHSASDAIIDDVVPGLYDISKVYLGTMPGSTCASGAECQQQLVQKINAGGLLVNYIGHGSVAQWESIFDRSTIGELQNSVALPVMLPMTCLDGYFVEARRDPIYYPDLSSLSELVVRTAGKGAVASWGPTGLGVAYGHDQLDRGFLEALLVEGIPELGPATYAGKLRLYNAGHSLEQIEEYTVFGDPALRIKSPADLRLSKSAEPSQQVAPGDIVTFTLAFTNAGPGIAFHVTLTDLLPSELLDPAIIYSTPEVISQHTGTTFTWTITDLWPHTGGEIRIRSQIDPAIEDPSFFNSAMISGSTPDPDLTNNHSVVGIGTKGTWLPLILKSH